jgi:hypothetical protein
VSGYSPKAFCPYCGLNLYKGNIDIQRKCHQCNKRKGIKSMHVDYHNDTHTMTQMVVIYNNKDYLITLNVVLGNWCISETESVPSPKIIKVFSRAAQTINFYCIFDIEKSGITFRGYSLKKPNDNISWVISSLTKDLQMETLAEGGSEFLSPEEGWLLFQRFLNLKAFL